MTDATTPTEEHSTDDDRERDEQVVQTDARLDAETWEQIVADAHRRYQKGTTAPAAFWTAFHANVIHVPNIVVDGEVKGMGDVFGPDAVQEGAGYIDHQTPTDDEDRSSDA